MSTFGPWIYMDLFLYTTTGDLTEKKQQISQIKPVPLQIQIEVVRRKKSRPNMSCSTMYLVRLGTFTHICKIPGLSPPGGLISGKKSWLRTGSLQLPFGNLTSQLLLSPTFIHQQVTFLPPKNPITIWKTNITFWKMGHRNR